MAMKGFAANPMVRYVPLCRITLGNMAAVLGFEVRCGLAMLHKLAGVNPAQVIASHEPGIEPCRHSGNDMLDA